MALIDIKQIAWTALRNYFIRKDAADSTSYKLTANGFDASSAEITNVGAATTGTSAPNWAQVQQLAARGDYRGMIHGYVKVISSTPMFFADNGSGSTTGSTTATTGKLYLVLDAMTISSVAYEANDVIYYNGSSFVCDNTNGSFDASSADANPGGVLASCSYNIKVDSLPWHELPKYVAGTGTFSDGTYLKWNAEYDSSADNNVGRWAFFGSEGNVPAATKSVQGRVQVGDGISVSSGVIAADIDTTRGLSLSGTSPNKKFGLNISTTFFEFLSGVLSIKTGVFAAASHTHTAADVPVRGMFTDSFTGIALTSAGTYSTLTLTYVPVVPTGVSTENSYKCVSVYINGVRQSFALTTKSTLSSNVFTLKRDSIEYVVAATDVIDIVYIPAV